MYEEEGGEAASLKVLTLNARFLLDRHHAREGLIKEALSGHDVVCLQEVATGGAWAGQEKRLAQAVGKEGADDVLVTSDVCVPTYIAQIPVVGGLFMRAFDSRVGLLLRDLWHVFNDTFLEGFLSVFDGATLFHMPIIGHVFYVLLGSVWLFGNSTISRQALRPQPHRPLLVGGTYRVAQKTLVRVPLSADGARCRNVWVVNTHLTDTPQGASLKEERRCQEQRTREFLRILIWLESDENMQPEDAVIMMGDFNARPHERLHSFVAEYGFRSAYEVIHGAEPAKTFHQQHECPTKDVTPEECIDYIFFRGPLQCTAADLRATQPHPEDARIYPSDHFAVSAAFAVL